jgi:hypothetical protein
VQKVTLSSCCHLLRLDWDWKWNVEICIVDSSSSITESLVFFKSTSSSGWLGKRVLVLVLVLD